MKLSKKVRQLLDAKCGGLKISPTESRRIIEGAHQQQATTGIAGHENLKAFAAMRYFPLLEFKIKAAHVDALNVMDSCNMWDSLREIPPYVDSLLSPFVKETADKVTELTGSAPWSTETKDASEMYSALKTDFEYRAELAIRSKRKDFILTSIWVPVVLLLLDRLVQLF